MKKFLAIVLALALVLGLTACANKEEATVQDPDTTTATDATGKGGWNST